MMNKNEELSDMERSDCNTFQGSYSKFCRRDWGKPWKTSFRVTGSPDGIQISCVPNM